MTNNAAPHTFNPSIWRDRKEAVRGLLKEVSQQFSANQSGQPPNSLSLPPPGLNAGRQGEIMKIMGALYSYADELVEFLIELFNRDLGVNEKYMTNEPREYALRGTINQLGFDLNVLISALQQRTPGSSTPTMIETLRLADLLAERALPKLVADLKFGGKPDFALTYFQKSASVRLMPYTPNVALIAIPYTATLAGRDLLAIPHEVGHYVYRNGTVNGSGVANDHQGKKFSELLPQEFKSEFELKFKEEAKKDIWIIPWAEEIFADVYGCLIAGPVIALDFQEIVTDGLREKFFYDDADHPVPAVRGDIYVAVLESLKEKGRVQQNTVKHIFENWQDWCVQRGDTLFGVKTIDPRGSASAVPLSRVRDAMKRAVKLILDLIANEIKQAAPLWFPGESTLEVLEEEKVETLYDKFDLFLQNLAGQQLTQSSQNIIELPFSPGISPQAAPKQVKTETEWIQIVNPSGWALEGPGGGNTQPPNFST